jgi:DNL zinc finger
MDTNPCEVCQKQQSKLIEVQHFHDRQVNICSSQCLMAFAISDYLKWRDQQLSNARAALRETSTTVRDMLAAEPHSLLAVEKPIKRLKDALYFIDHKSA